IGVEIGQRPGKAARVPLLAGGGTGMAAHTDVEVDDEPKLFLARSRLRQRSHRSCSHAVAARARPTARRPCPAPPSEQGKNRIHLTDQTILEPIMASNQMVRE